MEKSKEFVAEYVYVSSSDFKLPYIIINKTYQYLLPYYHTNPQFEANEIIPGIYLGNILSAYDKKKLHELGISHVLSVIEGFDPPYPNDFTYLVVNSLDTTNTNLSEVFHKTNAFIDSTFENNQKILIHCSYGVSRSATVLCAFLIKTFGFTVEKAIETIKQNRQIIRPNSGFVQQLELYAESL